MRYPATRAAAGLVIVLTAVASMSCAEAQGLGLIEAVKQGHLKDVRELIKRGAEINARDKNGLTALMWASVRGHAEVAKELLSGGADINARDNEGYTALMWASSNGKTENVKELLARGAVVNAKDKNGLTALQLASLRENPEVVKLLKGHGATETGAPQSLSDTHMWGMALLLLIAFAMILFSRIAKNRRIRWVLLCLGAGVWSVVSCWIGTRGNDGAFLALLGFPIISAASSDLIALPILRRRIILPCFRVRRTSLYKTVHSFFLIAIGILILAWSFGSPKLMVWSVLVTASIIIYLVLILSERVEVCGNGISQYQGVRPWEDYESFSWKGKTKYGVELWLMPKSWRSWVVPSDRLLVAPEDREAVQELLEANLPDQSTSDEDRKI